MTEEPKITLDDILAITEDQVERRKMIKEDRLLLEAAKIIIDRAKENPGEICIPVRNSKGQKMTDRHGNPYVIYLSADWRQGKRPTHVNLHQ